MKFTILCVLILLGTTAVGSTAWSQNQAEGRKLYGSYCTTCHGDKGKGGGVAVGSLPVKPKDHTDGFTMNQLTDQFLGDVITKGGGGMGK